MVDRGLGKTAMALKAISATGMPAFVFAPKNVALITWPEEIKKWTPHLSYTVLHGKHKASRVHLNRKIYILNWDTGNIKWFYNQCRAGNFRLRKLFMVFDEMSMIKTQNTVRFDMIMALYRMFSKYKVALSGTPSPNGLHELWPQFKILDQGKRLGTAYYKFRDEHFYYSGPPTFRTTIKSEEEEKKIYDRIEDVTYRLSDADYGVLPPISYNAIRVSMSPKLQEQYDRLDNELKFELDGKEIAFDIADDNLTASMSKLRQFIQGGIYTAEKEKGQKERPYTKIHQLKLEAIKELMAAENKPMLVPINFRFELDMFNKFFNRKVPYIAGGTKDQAMMNYVRLWNQGKLPLLLCHPASISHGMNLQYGSNLVVWFCMTWSLERYLQLNSRLHRPGQKSSRVVIHHIIMMNTLDEIVLKVLGSKDATQNRLLDEFRRLYNYKVKGTLGIDV